VKVSSEGAASSRLRDRLRRGDFCLTVMGVSAVGVGKAGPFASLEGTEDDVEILNFGACLEGVVTLGPLASGGVDRPADPGRVGRGDSARARCDVKAVALRAGAEAIALGPPLRPGLLATEFKLALSSSCCRLLRVDEES